MLEKPSKALLKELSEAHVHIFHMVLEPGNLLITPLGFLLFEKCVTGVTC